MDFIDSSIVARVPLFDFVVSILLAITYGFLIAFFMKRYSRIVGNKGQYLTIFPILVPAMVLIITIIKSSLALSLGLVGALSIVRFRTPIKDPEELVFIFVAIACGLGLGANQTLITSITLVFILTLLFLFNSYQKEKALNGIFVDMNLENSSDHQQVLSSIGEIFAEHKINHEIRRFDSHGKSFNSTFYLEPENLTQVQSVISAIKERHTSVGITLINKSRDLA